MTPKPSYLPPDFAAFPGELTARAQWVLWKAAFRRDGNKPGKWTKEPYRADGGGLASSTDPATWAGFSEARAAYLRGGFDGVGFVLCDDDPFAGIDLDDSFVGEDGEPTADARALLSLLDSYTERSPSSKGFRVFIVANLPPGGRKKGDFECYQSGRYLTVTGARLSGFPAAVETRQEAAEEVHRRIFPPAPPKARPAPSGVPGDGFSGDDADLLSRATQARNGPKIAALYSGDTSGYPGASEADFALCGCLAFYVGDDAARLDRLFRASGLYREKWDERHYANGDTYGQRTIQKAIEGCAEFYGERGPGAAPRRATISRPAPARSGGEAADEGDDAEKPVIVVTNRPDRDIAADAWAAIHALNEPPTLYTRGEGLASIGCDAEEDKARPDAPKIIKAKVRQVDEKALLFRLRRVADFVSHRRINDKETGETRIIETHVPAPLRIAEDVLLNDGQRLRLPVLRAVVNAPAVNQRGELLTAPGYHRGGLYLATEGLPAAPAKPPTAGEARAAYLRLFGAGGVFDDFPFAADCDRANAAALLLTPFLRPYIASFAPLALIEAPEKGTGKTLLARNLLRVFDPVPPMVSIEETVRAADMSAELNKVLTMALKSGPASLLIDNVRGTLSCSLLEALLTTIDPVSARLLGSSVSAAIYPDLVTLAVTSNNAEASRDMARRSYIIRLDANMERPEDRTDFKIPDIDGHIAANRPGIIAEVLTILSAWIGAGRPEGGAVKGGFQRWASVLSGVLDFLSVPGFLAADKDAAAALDAEGAKWGAFAESWFDRYGTMQRTAKELLDLAEEADIIPDQHAPRVASHFGKMLARNRERVFAGKKILCNTGDGGILRYWLKSVQTVEKPLQNGSNGSNGSRVVATPDLTFSMGENKEDKNMGHRVDSTATHLTHLTHSDAAPLCDGDEAGFDDDETEEFAL